MFIHSQGDKAMQIRHPFEWLTPSGQIRAFIFFFIFSLLLMVSLQITGAPLITRVSPSGILSFEFVGDLSAVQDMVNSWGQSGRVYAGLNLGLDYLFLLVYACAIGLGCVLVARSLSPRTTFLANLGILIAWAQLGAALLDCVENYALIQVLFGTEMAMWPVVARWCAFPKFSIVGAGLIYVIIGTIVVVVLKVKKRDEHPA
jgi:hypothetical protein